MKSAKALRIEAKPFVPQGRDTSLLFCRHRCFVLAMLFFCTSAPAGAQTAKNTPVTVVKQVKQKRRHVGKPRRTIHIVVDGLDRGGDIALTYRDRQLTRAVVLLCGTHSDLLHIYDFTHGRLRRVQERKTRYPFVDNGKNYWDFSRPVRDPTLTYSFAEDGSLRKPAKTRLGTNGNEAAVKQAKRNAVFQAMAETLRQLAVKPPHEIDQTEL